MILSGRARSVVYIPGYRKPRKKNSASHLRVCIAGVVNLLSEWPDLPRRIYTGKIFTDEGWMFYLCRKKGTKESAMGREKRNGNGLWINPRNTNRYTYESSDTNREYRYYFMDKIDCSITPAVYYPGRGGKRIWFFRIRITKRTTQIYRCTVDSWKTQNIFL